MTRTLPRLLLACSVVLIFTGCTIRVVDFTMISTKNVKVPSVSKGQRVTGEDCIAVVILPFGIPNMKEAIDRAIESAGGEYDALVDGVVYQATYAFIFGKMCYTVEGTPINTRASTSMREGSEKHVMYHSSRDASRNE